MVAELCALVPGPRVSPLKAGELGGTHLVGPVDLHFTVPLPLSVNGPHRWLAAPNPAFACRSEGLGRGAAIEAEDTVAAGHAGSL
jgi:hypothetical protein